MIDCLLLSHELTIFSLLLIICHIRIVTQKIVVLYFSKEEKCPSHQFFINVKPTLANLNLLNST